MKTASICNRRNPTNINALKLKKAQNELANVYLKEQTEYIQNQVNKIRDSVEDKQSRITWQTVNEVSKRKSTAKAKLKATSQEERIHLWKQHFENLPGKPPRVTHEPIKKIISNQLDIKLEQFMQEELDSVLRKIKNRIAAKLDEISSEIWKTREFHNIQLRHCNAIYNQNNRQDLPRYNPYIHRGQNQQCSTTQPHRTQNWEDIYEEPKWLSEKSIHDIKIFDYPSNSRCTWKKKPWHNNIICRFLQGLWRHTQRKEQILLANDLRKGTVATIMMLNKIQRKSPLPGWRHRLLRHCTRYVARRHINAIALHHLPRPRA